MSRSKNIISFALSALFLASLATNVMAAEGKWEKHHPRRD